MPKKLNHTQMAHRLGSIIQGQVALDSCAALINVFQALLFNIASQNSVVAMSVIKSLRAMCDGVEAKCAKPVPKEETPAS